MLDNRFYKIVTGLVLLFAAAILVLRRSRDGEPDRPVPFYGAVSLGAAVGFVSGLTGVGGGVFLAPLLIALQWASPRQTAALSSAVHIGKFDRGTRRCHVRRTDPFRRHVAVHVCGSRRRRDRYIRWATLVIANHDPWCAGRDIRGRQEFNCCFKSAQHKRHPQGEPIRL
ncbi:MAG: sulfite exporter TauE/SafE family protein [Bradyrhizobium sp.]